MHLVERVPDPPMVVEFEAAGEGDLRPGGQQDFGFGAAFGREEVAAVDHRGGHRAVIDLRAGAGLPGRACVLLECSAAGRVRTRRRCAFDQCCPSAVRRSSSTDLTSEPSCSAGCAVAPARCRRARARSRADGAVEEVDGRPEQFLEFRLEAGVRRVDDQGVEDVGDGACDRSGLRAVASDRVRPGRAVAVELEFVRGYGRSGMRCAAARSRCRRVRWSWRCPFVGSDRAHRGLHGDEGGGRTGPAPAATRRAGAQRRMAGAGYFASRCKVGSSGRGGK